MFILAASRIIIVKCIIGTNFYEMIIDDVILVLGMIGERHDHVLVVGLGLSIAIKPMTILTMLQDIKTLTMIQLQWVHKWHHWWELMVQVLNILMHATHGF